MVSVRLNKSLESRLNELSAKTHRTKSFYIQEALEIYMSELEDAYIALERVMRPNRKFYTSSEVLAVLKERKN